MRQFQIRSQYHCSYILPRKRTKDNVTVNGIFTVTIESVDEDDAPICFVAGNTLDTDRFSSFPVTEHGPTVVRQIGDAFYARRWTIDEFEALAATSLDSLGEGWVNPRAQSLYIGYHDGNAYASAAVAKEAAGRTREWFDGYDAMSEALDKRSADFRIVNGWIYERVGEPVICLGITADTIQVFIEEARPPHGPFRRTPRGPGRGPDLRFGLDQKEYALKVAERLAEGTKPIIDATMINSVAPWAVRFRGEIEQISRVADAITNIPQHYLQVIPPQAGLAWHDLATARIENRDPTIATLKALRRLHAVCISNEERGSWDWATHRLKGDILTDLSFILELWDARDANGFDWVENGLDATASFRHGFIAKEVLSLTQADVLSDQMGKDLRDLAEEASRGKGHLIIVTTETHEPVAGAFVVLDENGPQITEWRTAHGAEASEAVRDIVLSHVENARPREKDLNTMLETIGL